MYNVQCPDGHVSVAPANSELEAKCQARAERGLIGVMLVPREECDQCRQDRISDLRRELQTCSLACGLGEGNDCFPCPILEEIRSLEA